MYACVINFFSVTPPDYKTLKTFWSGSLFSVSDQAPPNFLHAAALAKHVKPVVVIPDEDEPEQQDDDDDDPEPLIEIGDASTSSVQTQPQVWHTMSKCTPPSSV